MSEIQGPRAPVESGETPDSRLRERYVGPALLTGALAYREITCVECGREWTVGARSRRGTLAAARQDAQQHICDRAASPSSAGGGPDSRTPQMNEAIPEIRQWQEAGAANFFAVEERADSGDFATEDTLAASPERGEPLRLDCDATLVRKIGRIAKRTVEGELPEDEPDYTAPWVYERIIMTALGIASDRANAELADLRAQLAEAREDTARLDWLGQHHHVEAMRAGFVRSLGWHKADGKCPIREAIDAARASVSPGRPEEEQRDA